MYYASKFVHLVLFYSFNISLPIQYKLNSLTNHLPKKLISLEVILIFCCPLLGCRNNTIPLHSAICCTRRWTTRKNSIKSSRIIREDNNNKQRKHTQREQLRGAVNERQQVEHFSCRLATLPQQHLNAASRVSCAQRITSAKRRQ